MSFEQIFRGEGGTSVKGGAYWSSSEEWAAQFTQTGRLSELKRAQIRTSDIYDMGPGERPYAGDPDAVGEAAGAARVRGFKAVRLDEGANEPPSIFVFDQTAVKQPPRGASRYSRISRMMSPPARDRRERAKDWKLERQRSGNEMPLWQEVLNYLKTTDGWSNRLDYEPEELRQEAEDAAIADGHDEGTPEWYRAVEEHFQSQMEEDVTEEQLERYHDVHDDIEHSDGEDCWREITLREDVDPRGIQGIGEFWADSEAAAEAHWGRFGRGMRKVMFRARVDLSNVDLRGTMFARMAIDTGPDEREIRFLKHAPIWVHDATLSDGTVVEINGWKRT